jgi:hypothetical protein
MQAEEGGQERGKASRGDREGFQEEEEEEEVQGARAEARASRGAVIESFFCSLEEFASIVAPGKKA